MLDDGTPTAAEAATSLWISLREALAVVARSKLTSAARSQLTRP